MFGPDRPRACLAPLGCLGLPMAATTGGGARERVNGAGGARQAQSPKVHPILYRGVLAENSALRQVQLEVRSHGPEDHSRRGEGLQRQRPGGSEHQGHLVRLGGKDQATCPDPDGGRAIGSLPAPKGASVAAPWPHTGSRRGRRPTGFDARDPAPYASAHRQTGFCLGQALPRDKRGE